MNESVSESVYDENDDSEMRAVFQQHAEYIRSFTAPNVLSENWNFLPGHDDLRRIDMSTVEFLAVMEEGYVVEDLAELGLYERVGDELRRASWLQEDGNLYVAIDVSNCTIAFSGSNDLLFPMKRTALDYAVERMPPDSTQAPATLFIVGSQGDVEVMQRLGLTAVSCKGLSALDGDGVSRLFSGDLRSDFDWRYFLLLVDFDLARLENQPQAAMHDVISRLADAEDVYSVDPSRRFGVCRPTASEFQSLERTIAFKNAAQIRQVFEQWSAAAKRVTVGSWRSHFALEKLSFSAASAALTEALRHPNSSWRRILTAAALPAYRAAGREAVIAKFFEAIDGARDPFDQVEMMAAASYAEIFLDADPLVRAAETVLAGQTPRSTRELQEEMFDQRQRCMVELRRIRRDRKAGR